jgi:hypothetical protein
MKNFCAPPRALRWTAIILLLANATTALAAASTPIRTSPKDALVVHTQYFEANQHAGGRSTAG